MPAESTFYQASPGVLDGIVALAGEACAEFLELVPGGSSLLFDAAWSQRRCAGQAFAALIVRTADPTHPVNGKVIAFDTVAQTFSRVPGNYVGSSQAMEPELLHRLLAKLEIDCKPDPRFVSFVHDQDAGALKVLRDRGWKLEEKLDLNHTVSSKFKLLFDKYNGSRSRTMVWGTRSRGASGGPCNNSRCRFSGTSAGSSTRSSKKKSTGPSVGSARRTISRGRTVTGS
jgi:hypothetical protein